MHGAKGKGNPQKLTRVNVLKKYLKNDCVKVCNGMWLEIAKQTLERNNNISEEFCQSVHDLLDKGHGKYRNILIIGPVNCGKTFILQPLTKVFHCFQNLASSTFAWVGAE